MKVTIKDFGVGMSVKSKGIEFEIRETNGDFLGDMIISNTKLIWCLGKVKKENGKQKTLKEVIAFLESDG